MRIRDRINSALYGFKHPGYEFVKVPTPEITNAQFTKLQAYVYDAPYHHYPKSYITKHLKEDLAHQIIEMMNDSNLIFKEEHDYRVNTITTCAECSIALKNYEK